MSIFNRNNEWGKMFSWSTFWYDDINRLFYFILFFSDSNERIRALNRFKYKKKIRNICKILKKEIFTRTINTFSTCVIFLFVYLSYLQHICILLILCLFNLANWERPTKKNSSHIINYTNIILSLANFLFLSFVFVFQQLNHYF